MKIQFLGTAAAEGMPAMFCFCDVCQRARKSGGKNIRTRSQAIVDDTLLIDFPADTYHHVLTHGLQLHKIEHCIITHPHMDHFHPLDFEVKGEGFAHIYDNVTFNVYGTEIVARETQKMIDRYNLSKGSRVAAHQIKPFEAFMAGNYKITPLTADHARDLFSVIYLIEKGGKAMLYANDTGLLDKEVWDFLRDYGVHMDFAALDCTGGIQKPDSSGCWINWHMSLESCRMFADKLMEIGVADKNTKLCLNHFSHNGGANYDDILEPAKELGFEVSYDGFEIEF